MQCESACINHKRNIRIDQEFENKLVLCVSTVLRHKNSMRGSQNGPLTKQNIIINTSDFNTIIFSPQYLHLPCPLYDPSNHYYFYPPMQEKYLESKEISL